MFLGNIKKREPAELFLKMACYVAMSEGDFSDLGQSINWKDMTSSQLDDFYIKFIDSGFSEIERQKIKTLTYDIKSGMSEDDRIDDLDRFFWKIKEEINSTSEKFLKSIKEDKELNKKIMLSMVESGADISSIDDNTTKASLLVIPETRESILESIVRSFSFKEENRFRRSIQRSNDEKEKNPALESLTLTQRKTMVFELVGMGNVDEEMGSLERVLVESACEVLGVEKDFIADAEEAIKDIMAATSEALELINE